ncbi:MAG: nucleotidyltransferase family protein, partial [Promethearchaeia archaeon]
MQLSKEKRDKIISILQKHGVKKIYLFGSYARDETTPKSDLDLIVEFPSY